MRALGRRSLARRKPRASHGSVGWHAKPKARGDVWHILLQAAHIGRELADAEILSRAALAYGLEITAALVDSVLVLLL
jgi:hypothetical protein